MVIYIAELSHTGAGRSPNVVPLATGYLAATVKRHFPESEITIFRNPNRLLRAVRSKKPDILALSIYAWSERLSSFCAQRTKEISKKTIVVTGGASTPNIDLELLRYLKLNPFYDIAIANEGENSFLRLVESFHAHGRLMPDETIGGCARLSSEGTLLRGSYVPPDLADIPSPYLGGFLDTFLREGYQPMIQSMRGCPYLCTFCVSGNPSRSRIRPFALERIFAEFDYIKKTATDKYLILADENFGLMGERDVKIAEYIIKSFRNSDFPSRLHIYTAKMVTDFCLKIIETLAPVAELIMSFETLDDAVKKEIKRVSLEYNQFLKHIQWAQQRKIIISTQMIFGFPFQTKDIYLKNLGRLLRSGVDKIYSYNLRLLSGAVLATQASRNKYNFKTMYRLPERTFGCYDGTVVTEAEEIVVESDSFNYDDYQKVRKYCLFLELASGQRYFSELIHLMIKLGLPGEKLVAFLAEHRFEQYPKLSFILSEYTKRARAELFETSQMCTKYVQKLVADGKSVPETKLNFIYTGKIMLDHNARSEFFEVVKEFVRIHSKTRKQSNFFIDYLDNVLAKQIVNFGENEEDVVSDQTRIRLDKFDGSDFDSISDLLTVDPISLDFVLHKDAADFLKKKCLRSIDDEETLQDIYMTVSRFGLLRLRKTKSEK